MNWFGVDRVQYGILLRLFRTLSDRRELTGQLGMDRKAMGTMQFWYLLFGGLLSLVALDGRIPGVAFLAIILGATVFMLVPMLVSEAANAFMNPAEAFVLAHQPIRGRTFIAAKATYILLTTLRAVLSLNMLPALAGLMLRDTGLFYPVTHLLSVSLAGLFTALMMCGMFGILFRFVPISRLRNAARWMQLVLAVIFPLMIRLGRYMPIRSMLPAGFKFNIHDAIWSAFPPMWFIALGLAGQPGRPALSLAFALPVMVVSVAFIAYGARSLSQDYMTSVVMMMRGERTRRRISSTRDWLGEMVRRLTGRPSGRAAYSFVSKMAVRDWQFRRFVLQGTVPFVFILFQAIRNGKIAGSPFAKGFAVAHVMPHALGFILMTICAVLPYSDQYRGSWIFLTVPMSGIQSFVRGVYWSLWLPFAAVPHLFILAFGIWFWGPVDALLFTAYSLALTSLYLGATLRLVNGLPFGSAPKARRGAASLPLMLAAFAIAGTLVALQYFFFFRHIPVVIVVTLMAGAIAVLLSKDTLRGVEKNVMHNLNMLAAGRNQMFKELESE